MTKVFVGVLCLFSAVLGASLAVNAAVGAMVVGSGSEKRKRESATVYEKSVLDDYVEPTFDEDEYVRRFDMMSDMVREFPEMEASLGFGSGPVVETLE